METTNGENKIFVSVCVAIHGVAEYLDKCLKSLLNQDNFKDYEVLLLLDSATKEDKEVAFKYSSQSPIFKIIEVDFKDQGLVRNHAIKLARGEYIYFVDGDDYLENNCLVNIFSAIKEKSCDVLIFNYYLDKNNKKKRAFIKIKDNWHYKNKLEWAKAIVKDIKIRGYVWNKVYKKSFLIENNLNSVRASRFIEDVLFNYFAFLKAKNIRCSSKYNYVYVYRKSSSLHSDPSILIEKYLRSLALMRYYSINHDKKESTNILYFTKKFMLLVCEIQSLKYLKVNFFKYAKDIIRRINNIKKCDFSDYLNDEKFINTYHSIELWAQEGENGL